MTRPKAVAYFASKQYDVRLALSFNYGQRHKKKLNFARVLESAI
jgi:7-cyano-7-deazaguanine synthase in queuosine biosynthesis